MIRPHLFFFMLGQTYLVSRKGEVSIRLMMKSQRSSGNSGNRGDSLHTGNIDQNVHIAHLLQGKVNQFLVGGIVGTRSAT